MFIPFFPFFVFCLSPPILLHNFARLLILYPRAGFQVYKKKTHYAGKESHHITCINKERESLRESYIKASPLATPLRNPSYCPLSTRA